MFRKDDYAVKYAVEP
ncbi:hypothetical protein, partial [Klebsiella pneumoniae]